MLAALPEFGRRLIVSGSSYHSDDNFVHVSEALTILPTIDRGLIIRCESACDLYFRGASF
jgi:hypothetical protein